MGAERVRLRCPGACIRCHWDEQCPAHASLNSCDLGLRHGHVGHRACKQCSGVGMGQDAQSRNCHDGGMCEHMIAGMPVRLR
ncbi:hypothetical protein HaLaN_01863 [Haematococcus lacustris]|uniref:Uncharacterized protein n=1 Tax=Haematococcus lacustris TaxID=44745 RepID=A0A699YGR9_HAELA|nr:hypothetical protein HaLaN_01863 [Haematococcus lacustris]